MLKCWFSCETSRLFDFELDKIVIVDSGLYAKKSRNWTLFLPRRALLLFAAQYCLHSHSIICSIFKKFWVVIDCQNYVFYTFWLRKESRKKIFSRKIGFFMYHWVVKRAVMIHIWNKQVSAASGLRLPLTRFLFFGLILRIAPLI